MDAIYPFSKFESIAAKYPLAEGCLIDANLLIAGIYELNAFHEQAGELFNRLARVKVPAFTTVTAKTEYLEFVRRVVVTEKLMDILADVKTYKLSERVKTELRKHKLWIDQQAAKDNMPVLNESRIKECKQVFEPRQHSGQLGWMKFCKEFLSGVLLAHWKSVEDGLGINYLQLRGEDSEQKLQKPIDWNDMYRILEKTGSSSNDAMILNAFFTSKLPAIITADFDVGYAVLAEKDPSKTCFVPDSMYSTLEKLRF